MEEFNLVEQLKLCLGFGIGGFLLWRVTKNKQPYWTNVFLQGIFPLPGAPSWGIAFMAVGVVGSIGIVFRLWPDYFKSAVFWFIAIFAGIILLALIFSVVVAFSRGRKTRVSARSTHTGEVLMMFDNVLQEGLYLEIAGKTMQTQSDFVKEVLQAKEGKEVEVVIGSGVHMVRKRMILNLP